MALVLMKGWLLRRLQSHAQALVKQAGEVSVTAVAKGSKVGVDVHRKLQGTGWQRARLQGAVGARAGGVRTRRAVVRQRLQLRGLLLGLLGLLLLEHVEESLRVGRHLVIGVVLDGFSGGLGVKWLLKHAVVVLHCVGRGTENIRTRDGAQATRRRNSRKIRVAHGSTLRSMMHLCSLSEGAD